MLKGGVIMDVTTVEEARIAEEAGAVAVMALERVPAGERHSGNYLWRSAMLLESGYASRAQTSLWGLESDSALPSFCAVPQPRAMPPIAHLAVMFC